MVQSGGPVLGEIGLLVAARELIALML